MSKGLTSAQDAFFQAVHNVLYKSSLNRPSAYLVPAFIAHTESGSEILFAKPALESLIAKSREYVIQRFIPPHGNRVSKYRVLWSETAPVKVKIITRKSTIPFNSPKVTAPKQIKVMVRRSSYVQKNKEIVVVPRNNQFLRLPTLTPGSKTCMHKSSSPTVSSNSTFSQYVSAQLPVEKTSPYFACFTYSMDCLSTASPDFEVHQVLEPAVSSFKARFLSLGQQLTTLEFDLIKGEDGIWYFLDMKRHEEVSIEERIIGTLKKMGHEERKGYRYRSSNHRSLENLKEFFATEKPLSILKAPYLDPHTVQDRKIKLYRRMSLSQVLRS